MCAHRLGKTPAAGQLRRTADRATTLSLRPRAAVHRPAADDLPRSPGQPLAAPVTENRASRPVADFSHVPARSGGSAARAVEADARASTSGSHDVISPGGADKHTFARLSVGRADDAHEREADAVAREVVGPSGLPAAGPSAAPAGTADGAPLPDALRAVLEPRFGADLGDVRLHTGARADQLSRALGASAFTTGTDVFFRHGAYDPSGPAGQEVLAHELAHVVQQGAAERTAAGPALSAAPRGVAQRIASAPEQHEAIAAQLDNFIQMYRFRGQLRTVTNTTQAFNDLAECLGRVGIVYQKNKQSRDRNPDVDKFWVGDILDLLNTLYRFGPGEKTGFKPQKFWTVLNKWPGVLREKARELRAGLPRPPWRP